nr:MAG: 8-amino-7-oxononanoate synthase [Candidatus Thorarchaeota archaeon SMTZ1-83]
MGKFSFVSKELENLKEQGLYNIIRTIGSSQGAWFVVDGKKVLNLCSNNYLGFANHPKLKDAAKRAIDKYGIGPGAVRSIAGTMDLHLELEEKLAKFKRVERSLSLQSGLNSNAATIPALVDSADDVIFSDELNHASIIDGCRLTKARRAVYPHLDASGLEDQLKKERGARRKLIVTDGVFSMDGDVAPLPDIVELAQRYEAILMVDDAHGEGVLGDHGRGIADHFGLHGKVDIEMGTLSKAFGVVGGYLAGNGDAIEFLRQKARPFLFSSAVTPPDVAACIAAVEILEESDEALKKLWENAKYFKEKMSSLRFDIGNSQTPITPVILGEAKVAWDFSKRLFEEDIFAQAIGYPTVPKGKARIRVMISAVHSADDLDFALSKFDMIGKELRIT